STSSNRLPNIRVCKSHEVALAADSPVVWPTSTNSVQTSVTAANARQHRNAAIGFRTQPTNNPPTSGMQTDNSSHGRASKFMNGSWPVQRLETRLSSWAAIHSPDGG